MEKDNSYRDPKAAQAYKDLAGKYDPEDRLHPDEKVLLDKLEAGVLPYYELKNGEMVKVTNEAD